MKKILVFIIIALVTVSVFADTNTKWSYREGLGVVHNTRDYAVIDEKEEKILYSDDFKSDEYVTVCFSSEVKGAGLIFMVAYGGGIVPEEVEAIVYAENLDNLIDSFTPAYTSDNGFSLKEKDSEFIYKDMLYENQRTFIIVTENYMIPFNVNCQNLYKYSNYLY